MFAWFRRLFASTGLQPTQRPKQIIPPYGGSGAKGGMRPLRDPGPPPPIASVVTPADVHAIHAELARLVKLLEDGARKGESRE